MPLLNYVKKLYPLGRDSHATLRVVFCIINKPNSSRETGSFLNVKKGQNKMAMEELHHRNTFNRADVVDVCGLGSKAVSYVGIGNIVDNPYDRSTYVAPAGGNSSVPDPYEGVPKVLMPFVSAADAQP
jgi:hypothetical protein